MNVSICDVLQCFNKKKSKSTQSSYGKSQQHEFGYIRQYWVTDGGLVDLFCKLPYVIAGNKLPFCFVSNNSH